MTAASPVRPWVLGGLLLTGGAVLQTVMGFAAQLVLMRLLMPEDYGEFAIVLAGCGLIQMLLSMRLSALVIRASESALTAERRERYEAAMVWESAAAAMVTLAWLAVSGLLSVYALSLVVAVTLAHWTSHNAAFYERRMAYAGIVKVETGSQIVGHLAAVALVLAGAGAASLYLRELVVAVSRLAAFIAIGALSRPRLRMPRWGDVRALIAEARSLWLDGVLEGGFARMLVFAADAAGGVRGAGLFAQSLRLAFTPHQLLAPVVIRLSANLFARIEDSMRRERLLAGLTFATLVVLTATAAAVMAWADDLIPWLFGRHWHEAADLLAAMAGFIIFQSAFDLLRTYCVTQHRMRIILAARITQYAVFAVTALGAVGASQPVTVLAYGLSLSTAAAFLVVAGGVLRFRRAPKNAGE